jgi:hypothetical protein
MHGHCCCGPSFRHFKTAKEQREMLEEYREELEKELEGVKERIQELTKK